MERRRAQTAAMDWDRAASEPLACTSCGFEEGVQDMYNSADGLVCAVCFSAGEGELATAEPRLWFRFGAPFGYALLWLVPLLGELGYYLEFVWVGVFLAAVLGAPFLVLFQAEQLRADWKKPGVDLGDRWPLVAADLWHILAFLGSLGVAFALLALGLLA